MTKEQAIMLNNELQMIFVRGSENVMHLANAMGIISQVIEEFIEEENKKNEISNPK